MESYMTRQNAQALEGLEPQKVFSYFGEIASIPHGSKNEKQLSDFICRLGREKGWEVFQDEHYNVVLKKEASPGYERVPALLMQAHLDMVCEKVPGVEHDFLRDPLKLYRDGRYLRAKGTTLGADNGIGVALLLAVLDTEGLCHPRLEVLLTADEEAGMSGIRGFDGRIITAEHLLNLDSKMDSLTVACAGGQWFSFRMPLGWTVSRKDKTFRIVVDGLRGGHSGAEIDKGRGNAIRLMTRILTDLRAVMAAEIVGVEGEGKANVIPRRAQARVNVSDGQALREFLERWQDLLSREWRDMDGGVTVRCEEMEYCRQVLTEDAACRLLRCILLVPSGTLLHDFNSGEAVYSNNLGVLTCGTDTAEITCLARSSIPSLLSSDYLPAMEAVAEALGIHGKAGESFPCWEYVEDSPIRKVCEETYFQLNGRFPEIISRHAGSECGYILAVCPTLRDAVATGARLFHMHTTDECLDIDSVGPAFRCLCQVLEGMIRLADREER